jgi:ADP-heptose:LPS heptosyltransferase
LRKRLERIGRRLLGLLLGLLLPVRRRAVALGPTPRILVVRIDPRLGNAVLTTPLLTSLRGRYPHARLELLAAPPTERLLRGHPALDAIHSLRKRPWLGRLGLLRSLCALRRGEAFDVVIDAGNPTDPSFTQALIVRVVRARARVGTVGPFARVYSSPAPLDGHGPHEIDLRNAVLSVLPGSFSNRAVSLQPQAPPASRHPQRLGGKVGAGRRDKLPPQQWMRELLGRVRAHGFAPLLLFGPGERAWAEALAADGAEELAPDTTVDELIALLPTGRGLLSADSGPMHLGVALGVPTCGLFVSTEPARYGYAEPPHAAVDLRAGLDTVARGVDAWLETLSRA